MASPPHSRSHLGHGEEAKESQPHRFEGGHEVSASRTVLCPYCGAASLRSDRCESCLGHFDPLSRQATQNHMGAWYIRDLEHPFRPGCTYGVIRALVKKGKLTPQSVVRGPSTRQFWELARRTPGVAHLFGICHACQVGVGVGEVRCEGCGASFDIPTDRQYLGLGEVRNLPV